VGNAINGGETLTNGVWDCTTEVMGNKPIGAREFAHRRMKSIPIGGERTVPTGREQYPPGLGECTQGGAGAFTRVKTEAKLGWGILPPGAGALLTAEVFDTQRWVGDHRPVVGDCIHLWVGIVSTGNGEWIDRE
jgi:hypothetical protein